MPSRVGVEGSSRWAWAARWSGGPSSSTTLLSLVELVRAGRGRVVLLIGEPGIGKSRLMAELRRRLAEQATETEAAPLWIEGRCVSYGRNLPYHLLRDLVRSLLGLPSGTGEVLSLTRAQLDEAASALPGDEAGDIAPYLAHLLDLPLRIDEEGRARQDPDAIQDRYAAMTHRLLRVRTVQGPVVFVCEDVHWADPASVEVLRRVLPLAAQLPVLFIGALRSETESAGWELVTHARQAFGDALTEIRLEPLTEEESRDLVANLLVIESLPESVRDVILARAEGNPFFVEEVVRMLIERGLIERREGRWVATADIESVDIPETLHGLLLARIDQLPDEARRSLRVAAVIGRQFPLRVLERVLGEPEASATTRAERQGALMAVDTQVDTLEAKGLIRVASYRPELEYLFRHWLVQDAAYGSLLKQERRELHRQVGEALESLYPDRRSELAGLLAMHFEQAGETDKARRLLHDRRSLRARAQRDPRSIRGRRECEHGSCRRRPRTSRMPFAAARVEDRGDCAPAPGFTFRPLGRDRGRTSTRSSRVAERSGDPELLAEVASLPGARARRARAARGRRGRGALARATQGS